jgi:hypothetical protein
VIGVIAATRHALTATGTIVAHRRVSTVTTTVARHHRASTAAMTAEMIAEMIAGTTVVMIVARRRVPTVMTIGVATVGLQLAPSAMTTAETSVVRNLVQSVTTTVALRRAKQSSVSARVAVTAEAKLAGRSPLQKIIADVTRGAAKAALFTFGDFPRIIAKYCIRFSPGVPFWPVPAIAPPAPFRYETPATL